MAPENILACAKYVRKISPNGKQVPGTLFICFTKLGGFPLISTRVLLTSRRYLLLAHFCGTMARVIENLCRYPSHLERFPLLAASIPRSHPNHINLGASHLHPGHISWTNQSSLFGKRSQDRDRSGGRHVVEVWIYKDFT